MLVGEKNGGSISHWLDGLGFHPHFYPHSAHLQLLVSAMQ